MAEPRSDLPVPTGGEIVLYSAPGGDVRVECLLGDETIWLAQKAMADLFGVEVQAISKHLANIYDSQELQPEATLSTLEIVRQEAAVAETATIALDYRNCQTEYRRTANVSLASTVRLSG